MKLSILVSELYTFSLSVDLKASCKDQRSTTTWGEDTTRSRRTARIYI